MNSMYLVKFLFTVNKIEAHVGRNRPVPLEGLLEQPYISPRVSGVAAEDSLPTSDLRGHTGNGGDGNI